MPSNPVPADQTSQPEYPLLAAGTDTLLLRRDHADAEACRAELAHFARLERSPGLIDTYRLDDIGLWNAKATGLSPERVIEMITQFSGEAVPGATERRIFETMDRWGPVIIEGTGPELVLRTDPPDLLEALLEAPTVSPLVGSRIDLGSVIVPADKRGPLKLALTALRYPVDDRAALTPGQALEVSLSPEAELRTYQRDAVASWVPSGTGVIVLPCGAGKTITALAAAAQVRSSTLVLTTGAPAMDQWERELRRFTNIDPALIGHFGAGRKQLAPFTLATYQTLAARRQGRYHNLEVVAAQDWGLVIYDEVHLLPAAVFGLTADVQAKRRLGLTATLVREDGREADVFTLIGPKRYDVPWAELELQGWIAPARCIEVRVVATDTERMTHARAQGQDRAKAAAGIEGKLDVVARLLDHHQGEPTLIIGTYLDSLSALAERHQLPLVTGETPHQTRVERFDQLRRGDLASLVVSKVGNSSIDLPEVSVAIQVSGTFGSRQEEAQRLGRLLRPKADGRQATFYTLVARDTVEQEYSAKRQRFLAEQGYHYEIRDADDLLQ